jgi:hypothetical protein
MILKKIALPLAVDDRKPYWEAMILAITNDKFCSLRANFMQIVLSSFKVSFIQYKHGNGSVTLMRYLSMDKSITKNCSRSLRNSSQVMYGIHFKIIGTCIKRNIMPREGNLRKNVRQVTKMHQK